MSSPTEFDLMPLFALCQGPGPATTDLPQDGSVRTFRPAGVQLGTTEATCLLTGSLPYSASQWLCLASPPTNFATNGIMQPSHEYALFNIHETATRCHW